MATLGVDPSAAITAFRPAADYLSIATAALERGFKVTPVSPAEKRGVLPQWNRHPSTKLSEVMQHAKDYPTLFSERTSRNPDCPCVALMIQKWSQLRPTMEHLRYTRAALPHVPRRTI